MKVRRILGLVLLFSLIGTASVVANDAYEWYKGRLVKVAVNGTTLATEGVMLQMNGEGKTMLPLRDIAGTLQAMLKWDEASQTVHLYKPNVHISLTTAFRDGTFGTFGKVFHRQTYDFVIFAQIDSLKTAINSLKFEVVDPSGKMVYEHVQQMNQGKVEEMLWVKSPNINLEFKQQGVYTVKVYMKLDETSKYDLVSEKAFVSEAK